MPSASTGATGAPGPSGPSGPSVWASTAWRAEAVAWIDEALERAGLRRTGEVEQPHVRPWATVLRVPTSAGTVWMKAAGPGTAFEVGLYGLLARLAPTQVLVPVAVDAERSWILLPDGGPPIGERVEGAELADALVAAMVQYGELQRTLAPHVGDVLDLGVTDMGPTSMLGRFDHAVESIGRTDVAAIRPRYAGWCAQLAASALPVSVDHNDLHPWNVLGEPPGPYRFYDWGDAVVAHPFAAMLVPLGFVQRTLDVGLDDPRFLRARDAYLEGFGHLARGEDLVGTLEIACRVAKIARALIWERATRAAKDAGEALDQQFADAPAETVGSLLDESYLGGA